MPASIDSLLHTPLYDLHTSLGAKMVEFAGYAMPVQFAGGVMKEHLWTREKAGLFDVSHMGQAAIFAANHDAVSEALESLVPGEIKKLPVGRQRYTVLLNPEGGIIDDLMVSRPEEDGRLNIVVNAARKACDYALLEEKLPAGASLQRYDDRALLALQGPAAAAVLKKYAPEAAMTKFMTFLEMRIGGIKALVSRSGYTGEDGYEISVKAKDAIPLAELLLTEEDVSPIGLGARDSLRLEAGLCLFGHDLDEKTSPIEGNIAFACGKRRLAEGGFPGASRIQQEKASGPSRLRVGIKPEGRTPAREGVEIQSVNGEVIGKITSGGFSPSLNWPVAMGYVDTAFAQTGTPVQLIVRGKVLAAHIVEMPFVPHRYFRG